MPRLLDLFCGAGGAAMGYHRAGFEVVGVDIAPQPRYPFPFIQADALSQLWTGFDAIHASPPCQAYSVLNAVWRRDQGKLIDATRALLRACGVPYVIENVTGARFDLIDPFMLCGSMFGLHAGARQLRRHRYFEANFFLMVPTCQHRGRALGNYGHGYGFSKGGAYQGTTAERSEAMGIDWMIQRELGQAIPPAYTQFIGEHLALAVEADQATNVPWGENARGAAQN